MELQPEIERGPGKNKKKWNEMEDEKLVEAMLDVINSGSQFKSDNGFKPGFFSAVEKQLAVSLPNSGIKAKPHIESRIKTMKNDWSAVHDMLEWNNTSGFGWDNENSMLDAPQAVWQAYSQVHKNAAKWRGKKFPHYWDLCLVFGKDRANGRDAQTASDIVSEMDNEQEIDENPNGNGDGLEDLHFDHHLNNTSTPHLKEDTSTHRKRRRSNSWDHLVNSLKDSMDIIGSKIEEATKSFTSVLGTERDREELRKKLYAEMKKVDGLTARECNKAVRMLSRDEDLMVIFFTIDDEDKFGWVTDVLDGEV